ncbi:glycogen debranching protein GlgX [Propionivibrio sp.]|uniref:glycogen debranching protein GlgX n=1 Tax=Propionivibrio sp. TaxID=2212460 RepID=UPI003BF22146
MPILEIILICILIAGAVLFVLWKRRKGIEHMNRQSVEKSEQNATRDFVISYSVDTDPGGDVNVSPVAGELTDLLPPAEEKGELHQVPEEKQQQEQQQEREPQHEPAEILPGNVFPLGATFNGAGVNFALFSLHAEAVTLCLFDASGQRETTRLPLMAGAAGVWHGYLPGARSGLVYGYRVAGPYEPAHGHRFNPAKLVLDPYALSVVGEFRDAPVHYCYQAEAQHLADTQDNAAYALKARVLDEPFDWEGDVAPSVPWSQTVIYEAHVKGLTRLHPQIPEAIRGTYAGLRHPAMIAHLQRLGVTTLELLPIQYFVDEPHLQKMGFRNHWGYNSIGWFAPEPRYWSGREGTTPLSEVREMVKALHAAGIEVIMDVVFNHSGEGGALGPTLSLRGIDNAVYYALHSGGGCENWSGCGNALNFAHPRVVQLVMDCLRYWVSECHIDGFRFDLAVTLGRNGAAFSQSASLFAAMQQDPVLAQCKLIAEPWDIGPHGYQIGHFPAGWGEWNDQFRDVLRGFWLKDGVTRSVFAQRFAASADCFRKPGRSPATSINFLTAHDGFTLADMTSYNHKHNLANGEHNRDGHSHNQSWNCGEEGPSLDDDINLLRRRVRKAMIASLLLAQGTPMLLAGDELGHTQQGNNNAYCQDNELTWLDWSVADHEMVAFVGKIIALRKEIPALSNGQWWTGQPDAAGVCDVTWLNPAGSVMTPHDWDDSASKALMIRFDRDWLLLINGSGHQVNFNVPEGRWRVRLSTVEDVSKPGSSFVAPPRSFACWQAKL